MHHKNGFWVTNIFFPSETYWTQQPSYLTILSVPLSSTPTSMAIKPGLKHPIDFFSPKFQIFHILSTNRMVRQAYHSKTLLPSTSFCLSHCFIAVKGHLTTATLMKLEFNLIGGLLSFRGLVHYRGGEQDCMQAGWSSSWVLHPHL